MICLEELVIMTYKNSGIVMFLRASLSFARLRRLKLFGQVSALAHQNDGGALAYFALSLPIMLGISGLAIDVSVWHAASRSTQTMADAGALAIVFEMKRVPDNTVPLDVATAAAELNGFDGSAGDLITVNNPPTSGSFTGNNAAYEVIVRRPTPTFLARLVFDGSTSVSARAVATEAGPPETCVLSLEDTGEDAIKVNNGALYADGCDVQVNSDHPTSALDVGPNGDLQADDIYVNGGVREMGYVSPSPTTGASPQTDPLAGTPTPSTAGCDYTDETYSGGSHTLSPGIYCGGIALSGQADVDLNPGTYVIKDSALRQGTLSTTGQAELEGDGVTFYFEGDSELNVGGNGDVELSAPSTGDYTGILFYGDPGAPETTVHSTNGNGVIEYDGIMYFPTAHLMYAGNGNGAAGDDVEISMVIARTMQFAGNGTLNFFIDDDADLPPSLSPKIALVE